MNGSWAKRRVRSSQLAAISGILVIVAWLATGPTPQMNGNFGLPLVPPVGVNSVFATVEFTFPSILRGLVTLVSAEYRDSAGRYLQEDAWVVSGNSGCVVFAESIDEVGRFDLAPLAGHRLAGPTLTVMFQLHPSLGSPDFAGDADSYSVTLRMRFAGRLYSRRFEWVPLNGDAVDSES